MDAKAAITLERLDAAAKGDRWKIPRGIPAVLLGFAKGIEAQHSIAPYLGTAFIPVSPESGRDSGFESVTVPIGEGMEFSVRRG